GGLLGELNRQADRRRRISARHLTIIVDGIRVGTWDLEKGLRIEIDEGSELIEVRGRDEEGEVKLGTVVLSCTDKRVGRESEHTIVVPGGQKITFSVLFRTGPFGQAADGVVEVAYGEKYLVSAAWKG